ncbi:MAG: NYN domain-containing protein [Coriobacteriia bacterium]
MHRFAIFVDGSNQFGSFKSMSIMVDDYEAFYDYIFRAAVEAWRARIDGPTEPHAQLSRVYWYEVGSMDSWDLADPKAQTHLRQRFEADKETKVSYMAQAGPQHPGESQEKIADEAWALCFKEFKAWYEAKNSILEGMRRFHHGVRNSTDFIDVIECGHWKVDFIHRTLSEKGLDTHLAVDMATMVDTYDVALVISGDADCIPSMDYVKERGKHIAAVEFLAGYPPAARGKGFSSRLKLSADFVVQVYEMDLVSKGIARKSQAAIPEVPSLPLVVDPVSPSLSLADVPVSETGNA